jgi:CRISPR/Cas system Type II protein with McrA/HNH and RuvC-like nuclease domain
MKKVLGLDLGTNSVGWALVEKDDDAGRDMMIDAPSAIDEGQLKELHSGIAK